MLTFRGNLRLAVCCAVLVSLGYLAKSALVGPLGGVQISMFGTQRYVAQLVDFVGVPLLIVSACALIAWLRRYCRGADVCVYARLWLCATFPLATVYAAIIALYTALPATLLLGTLMMLALVSAPFAGVAFWLMEHLCVAVRAGFVSFSRTTDSLEVRVRRGLRCLRDVLNA